MDLEKYIRDIPNFPQEGIMFKDITPLLSSPEAFSHAIDIFSQHMQGVDVIVGLDARGFIFGGALAYKLGIPFVPVRKKGKLPYKTITQSYSLEYGENIFQVHEDAINPGQQVAMIDDLLATGGSMRAACNLVEQLGGQIHSINFLVELSFLDGQKQLEGYKKNSLIAY